MACSIRNSGGGTPLLIKNETMVSTTTDQDVYTATEDCWVLLYANYSSGLVVSIKNVGNLFGCNRDEQWEVRSYANLEGRFPTAGYIAKFRLKNGETLVLNGYATTRTFTYEVYK